MDTDKLNELHRQAFNGVKSCINHAEEKTRGIRIGEMSFVHTSYAMDIEMTIESLKQILNYKKELAYHIVRCHDDFVMDQLLQSFKYSDEMIKKILGMP